MVTACILIAWGAFSTGCYLELLCCPHSIYQSPLQYSLQDSEGDQHGFHVVEKVSALPAQNSVDWWLYVVHRR